MGPRNLYYISVQTMITDKKNINIKFLKLIKPKGTYNINSTTTFNDYHTTPFTSMTFQKSSVKM